MEPIYLTGRYASASVFARELDEASARQIVNMLNQPFIEGLIVRMMPDVHVGAGCTVGTTMTVGDKVVPGLVGIDIGCGMHVVRLRETHVPFEKLDKLIREKVPSGMQIRQKAHPWAGEADLSGLICVGEVNRDRALRSVGTLGGGNHFIELDRGEDGTLYLVIHSGSRFLGKQVAEHYQRLAYDTLNQSTDADLDLMALRLAAEGMSPKKVKDAVKTWKNTKHTSVPREYCYLEGQGLDDYLHDMRLVQDFADLNRRTIAHEILSGMGLHAADSFTTVHNYIDVDRKILRKGAVSARAGELLLIPMNMRDGALLCRGKGDPDWNFSAPHGAGRLMSRGEAKSTISMKDYRAAMEGIFTTSVSTSTVDESPMAYKPMQAVISCLGDTADILEIIKPLYNFKAGEE